MGLELLLESLVGSLVVHELLPKLLDLLLQIMDLVSSGLDFLHDLELALRATSL